MRITFSYRSLKKIIFMLIALVIMFLMSMQNASAKQISNIYDKWSPKQIVVDNTDTVASFGVSSTGNWANWGLGTLRFSFTVIKVQGDPTAPVVMPTSVSSSNYTCDIQTTSVGNSTFTGSTYSASCRMVMGGNGFEGAIIFLTANQQNLISQYKITMGPNVSFESDDGPADYSSITNGLNNQTNSINSTINSQTNSINSSINSQTNAIQNSNANNTGAIISNANSNTNSINNNNNANTDKTIESQKVCSYVDKESISKNGYFLNSSGLEVVDNQYGITKYIKIYDTTKIKVTSITGNNPSMCFYNSSKTLISCTNNGSVSVGSTLTIPSGSSFFRASINRLINKPTFDICNNGNQSVSNSVNDVNDSINNDDTDGASSTGSDFFDDFETDSHGGISGIITSPLRLINSISSSSCSPLTIPLPFVENNVVIPCMSTIYNTYFSSFLTIYQLITTGIIGYWVAIKLFAWVRRLERPDDDRIEVLEL